MVVSLRCETRLINPIINIIVRPLIRLVDLGLQILGQEIHFGVLVRKQVVEFMIHHADNLTALVADDRLLHFVVQRRHREAAGVVGLDVKVDVAEVGEGVVAGDGVGDGVFAREVGVVFRREAPACRVRV